MNLSPSDGAIVFLIAAIVLGYILWYIGVI
jgi:hypothetical protein